MYYLDPQDGSRRRARVRDKVYKVSNDSRDYARVRAKRLADKSRGWAASLRSRRRSEPVSDPQLNERVRSRLGRLVSHPHGIESHVASGHVVLQGAIIAAELPPLMAELWRIPGVRSIDNRLTAHEEAGNEPALQGEGNPASARTAPRRRLLLPLVVIATPIAVALSVAAANNGGRRSARKALG
jgi:hypothetical protein